MTILGIMKFMTVWLLYDLVRVGSDFSFLTYLFTTDWQWIKSVCLRHCLVTWDDSWNGRLTEYSQYTHAHMVADIERLDTATATAIACVLDI